MIYRKVIIICLSVFLLTGCDLTSKKIAENELKDKTIQSYLGGSLHFLFVENSGGMLSIGSELSDNVRFIIFQLFVAAMLLFLFVFTVSRKNSGGWELAAFILFLSGGIGNFLSRITNDGKVIDFIIVEMFDYHTGIFNIADVYVMIGIILLVVSRFIIRKTEIVM